MPPKKRTHSQKRTAKDTSKTKLPKSSKRQHVDASYTLFISNLNTHIKSNKMRENLYILFSSFADVLQLSYPRKNFRGQGWIVVSSSDDANECVEKLNGFSIFDQELSVKFARKDGEIIQTLKKIAEKEADSKDLIEEHRKS